MDDRKRGGEECIAEHTSKHDNQKIAWNIWWHDINSEIQPDWKNSIENQTICWGEEEISFHEQKAQNLLIEIGLEGIENAKRNYNDTRLRHNALREIEMKKPVLMVYTEGR
jgi:hypothetical protein